jgi:hypothetical protein
VQPCLYCEINHWLPLVFQTGQLDASELAAGDVEARPGSR